MKIWIRGGRVVDPSQGWDRVSDVLIEDGRILAVGENLESVDAQLCYDARGKLVVPGLVDMHVHLRDPGQTQKEDIISGTAAAAAGGVTSVCCMPNTAPVADTPETVRYMVERAKWGSAHVYPIAAITKGIAGGELCDYPALKEAGAVALSDDGHPVESTPMLTQAAYRAAECGLPIISHCEDLKIIDGGIIHRGRVSEKLGVKGMDRSSEDLCTAREIEVAKETGTHIHIAHVSTAGSVELLRKAKKAGIPVSGETCPHYFSLTDEALLSRDPNFRMNPPLREEEDRLAILEGLCDGTLDAIATDHAPHTAQDKADFLTCPNGIVGLETSFMISYTQLVRSGKLSLGQLIRLMSLSPAKLLGLPAGTLKVGAAADLAVFDLEKEVEVCPEHFRSRARNTPFAGQKFYGPCQLTICAGRIVHQA